MNKVILLGRLCKDNELSYLASGSAICKNTLAVDRQRREGKERETDFFYITCFGKTAENTANYTGKGSKVLVEGRIQIHSYEDKEGNKRTSTDIIAEQVTFLDKKQTEGE